MSLLVVMDIDGTIADATRRFKLAGKDPGPANRTAHDEWVARVQNEEDLRNDPPVPGMNQLILALGCMGLVDVVYLTGREDVYRQVTEQWLAEHKFPSHLLEMRPTGSYERNCDFKEKVIKRLKYIYKATEVIIVDDDQRGELEVTCANNGWVMLKAVSGGKE